MVDFGLRQRIFRSCWINFLLSLSFKLRRFLSQATHSSNTPISKVMMSPHFFCSLYLKCFNLVTPNTLIRYVRLNANMDGSVLKRAVDWTRRWWSWLCRSCTKPKVPSLWWLDVWEMTPTSIKLAARMVRIQQCVATAVMIRWCWCPWCVFFGLRVESRERMEEWRLEIGVLKSSR